MLNKTDLGLLRALVALQDPAKPLNVDGLAAKLAVSPAFVSQRLKRLEREGLVERRQETSQEGRVVFYLPRSFYAVQWVSRSEGVAQGWTAKGEIDWSFPLVSQVPDGPARTTLTTLLHHLRSEHLLDPWEGKTWRKGVVERFLGLTIIHYGSTARGEARPGADVDLLFVHGDATPNHAERAADLAAGVSLQAARPIQVKHLNIQQLMELPERMWSALKQDGLIVYDGLKTKPGGETRGIWKLVYGGRPVDRS